MSNVFFTSFLVSRAVDFFCSGECCQGRCRSNKIQYLRREGCVYVCMCHRERGGGRREEGIEGKKEESGEKKKKRKTPKNKEGNTEQIQLWVLFL